MINEKISQIFRHIAFYLEMEGVAFKPQAYEKAADNIEVLSDDLSEIYKRGGLEALEKIPAIGKSMAEHIVEYLKTGKIQVYEALKKKTPIAVGELLGVEGLGPKKIKVLYQKLKVKNLTDLEAVAKKHKIASLAGFGEKTEQNILEGIEFVKRSSGRVLLGSILPKTREIMVKLAKLKEVELVYEAGSLRRRKETIGDADILVVPKSRINAEKIINFFIKMPGAVKVWGRGLTKASIHLEDAMPTGRQGYDVDLRVLPKESFGAGLQYFTGSKEHNIVLRRIAIEKGLKLNEYGLFRGSKMITGKNEKEIYKALGMDYIEPELRENQGEIEAAINDKLPKLIDLSDIKGDFHCHSHWRQNADKTRTNANISENIGKEMIAKYAEEAIKKGYEYLGISDHTKFLHIEHGLDEKQLAEQRKYINKINQQLTTNNQQLKILQGCEANILADGSIDISDESLAKLDYVIAGVHSQLKMGKKQMTERIIKAMRNPRVDIIAHPTGRILQRREEYAVDFDRILKVAKETGTILEINASPSRSDLKDVNIRKAKEAGVKMIINTDAHQPEQMNFMEYGAAQARRGWAEKEDIINCWPFDKLVKLFK